MINKEIPAIPVIFFTTRTSLKEIAQFIASVAKQLYAEAARLGLLPVGPLQWVYTGADGKPDTVFTLEIALPVAGDSSETTVFGRKVLPVFECMASPHYGSWEHLYETYDRLVDEISARGRKLTGICREQYTYMDFTNPANNITEVQMGI